MIKLYIYRSSTDKYDITNMIQSVTWAGEINTMPRSIEVELKNTNDINGGSKLITYGLGELALLFYNGEEVFRGYIFKKSINNDGNESFTAYDELIYVTKNNDSLFVKNKSASDVIISLFRKFGIPIGSIESTGYKIPKLVFEEQALADIIAECLLETKKNKRKSYTLYSSKGKTYMVSRQLAPKATVRIDNIITGSRETSIEDTRTQVTVFKGALEIDPEDKDAVKYQSYTVKDNESVSKYGVMQHMESVDDTASVQKMRETANSLLSQMKQIDETASIEFIGDISCTTGKVIEVVDSLSEIIGKYFITSDSHAFSNGTHKMSLQLSRRLE